MYKDDEKDLQDAKKANQKAKQNSSWSASPSSGSSESDYLKEAKQLNQKSASSGSGCSSSFTMDDSTKTTPEEEAKKLNEQSKQNKSQQS